MGLGLTIAKKLHRNAWGKNLGTERTRQRKYVFLYTCRQDKLVDALPKTFSSFLYSGARPFRRKKRTRLRDGRSVGTVLIVDDDPDVQEVLKDRLESLGFPAVPALTGKQGLEFLDKETRNGFPRYRAARYERSRSLESDQEKTKRCCRGDHHRLWKHRAGSAGHERRRL